MKPREITPGVWVFTSALYQTTSTVLLSPSAICVVDPNWLPDEVMRIKGFVDAMKGQRKLYLLFTHSDYDHIIGYGAFTSDAVIASQAFATKQDRENDVEQVIDFDRKHDISRDYPITYPKADIIVKEDGQQLQLGEMILTFYLAQGHTDEGIFTIVEPQGIWVAGDYLSDIEFPLVGGSLSEYRLTLKKVDQILLSHQISSLIPGHGSVEGSIDGIRKRRDHAMQYLDDLEMFLRTGSPFPENIYRTRYPFWDGIRDWHLQNIAHLSSV